MVVRIYKINLQNGNNWPLVKSFTTEKFMSLEEARSYKKRIEDVFSRRYNKPIKAFFNHTDPKSKFND
jgi:hypothetical protein